MSEKEIRCSKHAHKRLRKRCHIKADKSVEKVQEVYYYGVHRLQLKGSLRRYIDKLYFSHGEVSSLFVYKDKVYIFIDRMLITVLPLPNNFRKQAIKITKQNNSTEEEVR